MSLHLLACYHERKPAQAQRRRASREGRDMAQVNPRHVDAVMELINRSPYFELLGIRLTALSEGACTVEAVLERKHLNAFGGAHGGAYASLLDCAAYWALYCSLDEDEGFTTVDLNASNLRASGPGLVVVEGRVVKRGRTMCLCEAELRDAEGRLLAHATSKMLVGAHLQPMSAAVRELGAGALPPKFLA